MKLKLTSGLDYGEGPDGKRVCRGAQMGRPNIIPQCVWENTGYPIRLHLNRLKWVDRDYDAGGSYWGHSDKPAEEAYKDVYCAWGKFGPYFVFVQVFVRALTRKAAKMEVRDRISNATFFHCPLDNRK